MTVEEQVREAFAAQRPTRAPDRDLVGAAARGARRRRAGRAVAVIAAAAAITAGIAVAVPLLPGDGAQAPVGGPPLDELLAGLPVGAPTSLGAVAGSRFTTPDGRTLRVPIEPGQRLTVVLPLPAGGWLAFADGGGAAESLTFVGDDGAPRVVTTGDGMDFAVDEAGERVAVGETAGIRVVSIATGETLASTGRLPAGMTVGGWAGDRVLVVGPGGDTRIDVWDPAGPYSGTTPDRGFFPVGSPRGPGEMFAGRAGTEPHSFCLVRVALPAFTATDEVCGEIGALGGAGVSPDGRLLQRWDIGGGHVADIGAAFATGRFDWTRLGLPDGVEASGALWETERTVVLDVEPRDLPMRDSLDLVRCDVVAATCERVPRPTVATAPAQTLVVGSHIA